jgi:hypothetical protein
MLFEVLHVAGQFCDRRFSGSQLFLELIDLLVFLSQCICHFFVLPVQKNELVPQKLLNFAELIFHENFAFSVGCLPRELEVVVL